VFFEGQKRLTTKFPLSVVPMELAVQWQARGLHLRLRGVPRDQGTEADELSNGITWRCKLENEVAVGTATLGFRVLPNLGNWGSNCSTSGKTSKQPSEQRRQWRRRGNASGQRASDCGHVTHGDERRILTA
jgi:hypothetical protein